MIKSNAGFYLYGLLFLGKILVEPVVPNVLKFDILLPEIDFAKSLHILNIEKFGKNHGLTVCTVHFP